MTAMTAERLRDLIVVAIREHPEVVAAHVVRSLYSDRVALGVEDEDHALWRIHVIREPLR